MGIAKLHTRCAVWMSYLQKLEPRLLAEAEEAQKILWVFNGMMFVSAIGISRVETIVYFIRFDL